VSRRLLQLNKVRAAAADDFGGAAAALMLCIWWSAHGHDWQALLLQLLASRWRWWSAGMQDGQTLGSSHHA
jgi:hypothetical protein